jgi:hypothetical protein
MSSHYSTAKSTQSESTRASYHTAREPIQDTSVCTTAVVSRRDSSSHDDAPNVLEDSRSTDSRSINSVDQLRLEGNFDLPFTDSKQLLSLSTRSQQAVAAIKTPKAAKSSNSSDISDPRAYFRGQKISGPQVKLEDTSQEVAQYTPRQLPRGIKEGLPRALQNLDLKASPGRTTKDASRPEKQMQITKRVPTTSLAENPVDTEPKEAASLQRFIAQRQKRRPVPIDQRLEQVGYDCWKAEHECCDMEGTLVDDPPQELWVEDLVNDSEAVENYLTVNGGAQISPDAP